MAEAAENKGTPTARVRLSGGGAPRPGEPAGPGRAGGPSPGPARGAWPRRLATAATALLAAVPAVTGLLPAQAASAATASAPGAPAAGTTAHAAPASVPASVPAASHTGTHTVDVSLDALTPAAPHKGDTLTLTGTVSNASGTSVTDGRVGLRTGPQLGSRSAIDQAARRTDYVGGQEGEAVGGKHATARVGTMRPGIRRSFTLKVPVSALHLGSSGVYQLGVTLTGHTSRRPYDQILGIAHSFLPWQTSAVHRKTKMTFLWPLVSTAHMTARTQSNEQQTPVFRNDDLAEELAPGGRLQQMVALGKDLPVTWVIDPDLLATVEAMTDSYRVQTKDGGTVPGKGQTYAKQWLDDLQHAVQGTEEGEDAPGDTGTADGSDATGKTASDKTADDKTTSGKTADDAGTGDAASGGGKAREVVALPFADPDLASLAHRGKNVPGALSNLGPATRLGAITVSTVLHVKPSTDYAWPVDGAVDGSIVDVATSAGAHHVIARSDSLGDTALSYTPNAARPIGGGTTALVADARLSRAFEGDLSEAGASSKAQQRFLGEVQAITAQVPTKQRSILVAPQRMPTASQAQTMAHALRTLKDDGRWTQSSTLADAAKAKPDPGANRHVPSGRHYPAALRRQELPTGAYEQVRRTKATLDDFQKILTQDDRVAPPFGMSIEREVSTSWRGDARDATNFRGSVYDYLTGLTKKVELIQKSPITLSGRSATIPVTVQNNLVQGVDGLKLKLTSTRSIGLDVGTTQQVRVDGGHSQSVKFSTSAKANGRSFVTAQLYTEDGKPYGKPMRFQVNVTSITSTVLLVIAGGVLLVVLAGVRMYTTRKRRGDDAPLPDPDAPLVPPEQAASREGADRPDERDEAPDGHDTGRESGSPPSAGEKVER